MTNTTHTPPAASEIDHSQHENAAPETVSAPATAPQTAGFEDDAAVLETEPAFTLTIDKLVYGGEGLGRREEGEILFVPWSAPGDQLRVVREPGKQKPARGRIEDILTPSPTRTAPRCDVFGACGGCQWQHMTPAAQRDWKRQIVQESLQRIGKLEGVAVAETYGTNDIAWRYRNRVQWDVEAIASTSSKDMPHYRLGYHKTQSRDVAEFSDCHIMSENLNKLALWFRGILPQMPQVASGLVRIEAFESVKGDILLSLHGEKHPGLRKLGDMVRADFPDVVGVVHFDTAFKFAKARILSGEGFLLEDLAGKRFRVSAGSFFQTNPNVAEHMVGLLQSWLPPGTESLLDLYAGVGTFALCLSDRAQRIMAIESSESAMADAKENSRRNNILNVALQTGDARKVLRTLKEKFEAAVIDPPRAGCPPEVLSWLSENIEKRLLYVSCNPTTLARDLKTLTAQGWSIQNVQPLDMFPQTYHVETLVHLTRTP